jgi:hypothetical protein
LLTGTILSKMLQVDKAKSGTGERLQPADGERGAHPGQRSPNDPQVQRAYDRLVPAGYLTERALAQEHAGPCPQGRHFGIEPHVGEQRGQVVEHPGPAAAERRAGVGGE